MSPDKVEQALKLYFNIENCEDIEFESTRPDCEYQSNFYFKQRSFNGRTKEILIPSDLNGKIMDLISEFKKDQQKKLEEL